LLYYSLKVVVRIASLIFCRKIIIKNKELLKAEGPLLIACNHPNSFLDAVMIGILFRKPVFSLTRGDVFKNPVLRKLFRSLRMLPVYRTREGIENLTENYKTFDSCACIFKQKGVVSIFSEGLCVNEWHLRALKKGTARLAFKCWENDIPLKVLPVGINYSSFRSFGKNVFFNIGTPINKTMFDHDGTDGTKYQDFNNKLREELAQLVFEIPAGDERIQQQKLGVRINAFKKVMLAMPAVFGYLFHFPLYVPVKLFTAHKFGKGVHYDSMLLALLLFFYPFYLLLAVILLYAFFETGWIFSVFFILPFTAWCFVQGKKQLDK